MKQFFTILGLITLLYSCTSGSKSKELSADKRSTSVISTDMEIKYDSSKAELYGADQYGMRPYVIAFLKTGPNPPKDSIHAVELQTAHMNNIGRLAEEGKLVIAGPFYGKDKGDYRGIYIFDTSSIDSAMTYTKSDPAIQYGLFVMELKQWYGSAALKAVNGIHQEIAEIEI